MRSILWLWLAAAVPCWATLSASDDLDPRSKALDPNRSSQPLPPTDLLPSSGSLLGESAISTSVRVGVAELSARESFTEGQGTVVAVSGNKLQYPSGNLVFVHARDRFGNVRDTGKDLFSMDPLMVAALHATQLYIGGGSYQLTYWWETQHSRVAYEVCPRSGDSASVARLGQCQSRAYPADDDRALAYSEVMVTAASPVGPTSAHASGTTCLAGRHDACGRLQAVAGERASFAIEARTASGAAHYGDRDVFLVTLDGQDHVDVHVSHLRLNYYEVSYVATQSGDYKLSVSLLVNGELQSLPAKAESTVRVFAAAMDPSKSSMAYDAELSVVSPIGITMTCRDGFGNKRDAVAVAAIRHEESGAVTTRQLQCIDGTGRISLRSTTSGMHLLRAHVELDGVPTDVSGSPSHIDLRPGPVDITRTTLQNYESSAVATDVHEVFLQARDQHNNFVDANDLDIYAQVTASASATSSPGSSGTHRYRASNLGSGSYCIQMDLSHAATQLAMVITVHDDAKNRATLGPFDLSVRAGPVNLDASVLDTGALRGAVAGTPLRFRAELSDAFGNPRTEPDHVELSLVDQAGSVRASLEGATASVPPFPRSFLEEDYVLHTAGIYFPRIRINQALELAGTPIVVTFGAPGPARIYGWRTVDVETVVAWAGKAEPFFLQSLDSFGNERAVDDVVVRVDSASEPSHTSNVAQSLGAGCTASYFAETPGLYKVLFRCVSPGAYSMRVSTAAAQESGMYTAARVDNINTPDGVRLAVFPGSSATVRAPPVWLVRPQWYRSAEPSAHARRLQVEIDYEIELELQEDDLSALLGDDNANASALDSSLQATLDARLAAAAATMTSSNFTQALAESVNEAAAEMARGCTSNAGQADCAAAGCRYAEYPVTAVDADSDPQTITLQVPTDLIVADTVMRIRPAAAGAAECVLRVTEAEGAVVSVADTTSGVVTFATPQDTTTQAQALANQLQELVVIADCVFTTCVTNVTLVSLDATEIVNNAPNITELLASVVVATPAFSGSATLQGSALQGVVCGERETITASVYDSFNNLQGSGSDEFDFQWVSLCLPIDAQRVAEVERCAAVDMSGADGGFIACEQAQGCEFSSGTPVGATPAISFNSTTSEYSFDFEIRNCDGAVHFTLSVNNVNVTTESGSRLLAPRSIPCSPGEISAEYTEATTRSQAANIATEPLPTTVNMVAGQRESIEFQAADLYDNKKYSGGDGENLAFVIGVPEHRSGGQLVPRQDVRCGTDASVDCGMADFNNGRYQAEYQVRYRGTYTLDILVIDSTGTGTSIFASEMSAQVVEGPAVPGMSNLIFSDLDLEVGTTGTVTIERFDNYGNSIPTHNANGVALPVASACSTPAGQCNQFYLLVGELVGDQPSATNPLELSYSSVVSGPIAVTVWFRNPNGAATPAGLPAQRSTVVTFAPSAPVLSNSLVVAGADRTVDCIAGVTSEFVIQTRDRFGNNCDRPLRMPSGSDSQCPGWSGICAWRVTLTACLGSTPEVQEACATEDSEESRVTFGRVTNGDAGSGQYTVSYEAPSTGYYKVRVQVKNIQQLPSTSDEEFDDLTGTWLAQQGSPFVILSDTSAVASACTVVDAVPIQTGLQVIRAGAVARFKLQANGVDGQGQPVARRGSGEQFLISVAGDRAFLDSQGQEYEGLGMYQMQYAAHATGYDQQTWEITVGVTLNGNHISGSPFAGVEMSPADTEAAYTYARGDALIRATAGMTHMFEVVARDAFDNAVTECVADWGAFELQLTLAGDTASAPVVRGCTADPFARYEVEYMVTRAAEFTLYTTYGGDAVSGSPHTITVGSSTVRAAMSFISVTGEYREDTGSGLVPGAPARVSGDFDTLGAGEVYTFFLHAFDQYNNRLTQNLCAGDATGPETGSCLGFAFRWCRLARINLHEINAATCLTNPSQGVSLSIEPAEGSGVYKVETAPGASGLSRSGGYRVDVTIVEADGTAAALSNSHFLLAVDPAAASATNTEAEPPLTIMASQTVTFEMAGRDEFNNTVDHRGSRNQEFLDFQAAFVCTQVTGGECASVTHRIEYVEILNRYVVYLTVDSGGNAAALRMTIALRGDNIRNPYLITVRSAQNEPSLCYVLSTEAGTTEQRLAASLPDTPSERRGRDCLNLDHKVAGDSFSFMIQSVLPDGGDRSLNPEEVCTPTQIANNVFTCDRLDEFELVAVNQVTQQQVGPFREDCADLCAAPGTGGDPECPLYAESECILDGLYGIGWSTTVAGDWEVTIRSLGVTIQTEPGCPTPGEQRNLDSTPLPGACSSTNETRPARFDHLNLITTGYLFQADGILASFVTHVYPAAMSAATSDFELTTQCTSATPCIDVGKEYTVTITAVDQYGNQLESETEADGQPCATAGCLASRVRAIVQTECRVDSPGLCTAAGSAFTYDANDDYPGHLRGTVVSVVAGLAKLQVELEVAGSWVEFSVGKKPVVVNFGVASPIPNSGFIQAGDAMQVEAAIYGFLDPPANIVPEFACEWVGPSVGGVHRTAATLLTENESLPNSATISLTIQGGGAGVSWELECNRVGSDPPAWDRILSGGGGTQDLYSYRYDEFTPCRENVAALRAIAEDELAGDLRQVAVVDWSTATCSSALELLQKYGMSCDVRGAAEVCPVACSRCESNNATTLTVTAGLNGACRLTPTLELNDVEEGSTEPTVTISAHDAVGITLLPEQTHVTTNVTTLEFTVVGLRKLRCDGGPPILQAKSQSLFEVSVQYTTTGDELFQPDFEAGQPGSQRVYASMQPSAAFFFYEDPVVSEVKLSTNAELLPGRPLFEGNAGRRVLQAQMPDYGGDAVFIPTTAVGDPHIPTLLSIVATELNNGAGADKSDFACMFNKTSGQGALPLDPTSANYLSDTELECTTPNFAGHDPGRYELLLSKNGQHFSPTGKVIQTFAATQIQPTFAAVQGVVDVEIEVSNGFATMLPSVFCRFGDWSWLSTAADLDAPGAGPSRQPTNALQVPLAGSVGDVVAATWVADGNREVWRCPVPEIQDAKTIKPRNVETPVRISYDGKAWTNAVDLFYFDQPDVQTPIPPIGPTGGGTLIELRLSGNNAGTSQTLAGSPRAYHLRRDEFEARCLFSELSRVVVYDYEDANGVVTTREANGNATVVVGNQNAVSLRCTTPPNPQPGSKYDLDISLDGGRTWAYDSDSTSGRALPSPPDFSYYAETAVITQDAATNYDSSNYFRGRIDRSDGRVVVRFQYSCGFTTAFTSLAKCKFGDLPPSSATLVPANIGATVINELTCDVPQQSTTGIVDLSISLNGIDFTALRAGDTTFVYFGEAVALRAWWQADASASASRVGTPGSSAGTTQVETDDPPTLAKKAKRVTNLDVIRVEIIDNQGSFVSEDPRKGGRISLALVQIINGQQPIRQSLTMTVGTRSGTNPENDQVAGQVFDADEYIWMAMQGEVGTGDTILNAPGVGNIAPQPGTTMFVGLQLTSPDNGNYEVRLDMAQDDCTGCLTPSCGCTAAGCCLATINPNTWQAAITAGLMAPIPQFRLGLTILVGDTSIVDTAIPDNNDDLTLDITPIQSFKVTLNTRDSAGNSRPEGGDSFQMRMYLQEDEIACGDYVTPAAADARETLDVSLARTWCGRAACGALQVLNTDNTAPCPPADNRAKRIQIFPEICLASTGNPDGDCVLTPASEAAAGSCQESPSCALVDWCTCTYKPERLICTDDVGNPLCQQYNPQQSKTVVSRDGTTETVYGIGGALPPGSSGVFAAEDVNLGAYVIMSGMLTAQEVTVQPSDTKVSLRLYGIYVIVIEGYDPVANLTTSNVINSQPWVEINDSPKYGRMSKVDCAAIYNEEADPPSPLLGGLVAPLVGSVSDAEGKICQCVAGYEKDTEYRVRNSADDPESSGLLPGQVVCKPCNKGYYKDGAPSNTLTCQPCPVTTTTVSGRCREKIRAVSSSNRDNGYFSGFGDLTKEDSEWYTTHHDIPGEAECVEGDPQTWFKCRRGSRTWKSDPTDARACEGVTNQGFRGNTAVPNADRTMCLSLATHRTALLNETYQVKACVYEPSLCERGECTSKSVCQCQDRHYDFRNIYLVCQKTEWFRLEASRDRMDSGGGTPGLRTLDKTGTYCASCPDCVKCYENGTIVLESEYWTFDEDMKMPAPYYWQNWEVPLRQSLNPLPADCPADDPYRCPAARDDVRCPDNKCIYVGDARSPNYKHWMITAYKCLHSPGGVGAPTCLGGDWTLAKVGQAQRDAVVFPGTNVACSDSEKAKPRGERPGCDFLPPPQDNAEERARAKYSNGFCLPGSAGTTCAVCGKGYKKDKGGEGCADCEESEQAAAQKDTDWGAAFLLFLTTIIVIGLGIFAMKRAKTDDILKIKILIAFGQVMQSFAATYSITWPPVIASFIDQFSIVSFDLFSIGSIECVEAMRWVKTFFAQFSFMVIAPAGCLALLFLGFKVTMYRDKKMRAEQGKQSLLEQKIQTIEIQGAWASRAFLLLILIYLKVSATVLEMFRCRSFEPYPPVYGDHPERNEASSVHQITEDIAWKPDQDDSLFGDGRVASDFTDRKGLEKDMLFTCTENTYIVFKAFAVAMVIVYPVGIPALFSGLMFRERDQISDAINQKKFGFLFADYVTMYFMWEILDLMRKLLLSGLMIFFNRGSVGQLLAGMVVALTFLEAQLRLMPYNDLLANIVQIVAFNAIFLNLLGALLTKVKFEDGIDSSLSADFANHFLIFINVSVPIVVLFMLAFSVGYDMYLISIGKMIKGGLAGKSRAALLEAIGMRKENRKKNSQKKNNIAETGFMALYHILWKREDVDEALLSEELAYLDKRRDERDKAIILFRQAQVHHEEKREWYRFVYNHTKTEEEFNEIVQTESLASYKRLMLGLEEDMEDDIHERVTREIVQASNVASDEEQDDDFANPVYADADDAKSSDSGPRKKGKETADPTSDAPAKKKDKKKKKTEDEEDGWFGEDDVQPKKSKKKPAGDATSTEDELAAAQVEIAALKAVGQPESVDGASKKKKKKKKSKGDVGTDPTAEFDVPDDEDPTAGDFDIETSGKKSKS